MTDPRREKLIERLKFFGLPGQPRFEGVLADEILALLAERRPTEKLIQAAEAVLRDLDAHCMVLEDWSTAEALRTALSECKAERRTGERRKLPSPISPSGFFKVNGVDTINLRRRDRRKAVQVDWKYLAQESIEIFGVAVRHHHNTCHSNESDPEFMECQTAYCKSAVKFIAKFTALEGKE